MIERPADKTHPRMLDLASLLEGVDLGRVALPDFQRDFEWSDQDVRSLLATILRGWPAGSLLVMAGRPAYLRLRPISDGPPLGSAIQWVILDGQQRITALYHALYDLGDSVYAIRLEDLNAESVDSIEESLRTFPKADWRERYPDPPSQADAELLPLYALRSAPDFYDWRDAATSGMGPERAAVQGKRLTTLYREQLSGLHRYELPAVVVPTETEPAAIARIFERVNKSGVPLGAFDLMVATSYDAPWNLRDHWDLVREEFPVLGEFLGDDGMPVLQVMALATAGDLRERAVLSLRGADVRANWSRSAAATDSALRFLSEACGVIRPDWLPYRNMIVVLGALAWHQELPTRAADLLAWYWATGIGERYDVASNTRAVADYQALLGPALVPHVWTVDNESLPTATRRGHGALYRAFASALPRLGLAILSVVSDWAVTPVTW